MSQFDEDENMIKLYPCRKFCCLLVMLSFMSIGHAQDATHKILKKVPVPYPSLLKARGIQGDVRLKVFIKADGSVKDTELVGGNPILAESAQKSVSQWKFSPGNSDSTVDVVVHFDPAAKSEN
jgi:TonB family protein